MVGTPPSRWLFSPPSYYSNCPRCASCMERVVGLLHGCAPSHQGLCLLSLSLSSGLGSSDANDGNQLWLIIGILQGTHGMAGEAETQAWHRQAPPATAAALQIPP